ncbi:MAG: YjiG family protein [Sporomusaceae bacterium]|nr:YjiG family protein [Sporomusaceae bacterium]
MANKTVVDMFVEGARKGWQIGIHSIMPNVVMAYTLIRILEISGLLKLVGQTCAPLMALFGLPGEAIMVNLAALLSMGGAVGVASSLIGAGALGNADITILLPAIFIGGGQVQNLGRLLGTSGTRACFYPWMFAVTVINTIVAMLVMRMLMTVIA